jgi:hypothetical protein
MLALQSSEPLILLIRDADVLHDRVLSIINSIVTDGTIPAYSMSSKEQVSVLISIAPSLHDSSICMTFTEYKSPAKS